MNNNNEKFEKYTSILKEELVLALGCTEPIAIALASARCVDVLGERPDEIIVNVSGNIIKNVQGVIIPGTKELRGVELSALLGMIVGKPEKQLEVLQGLTKEQIEEAICLQQSNICSINHAKGKPKLYIEIIMKKDDNCVSVEVMHQHTNVTRIIKNGKNIAFNPCKEEGFNSSLTDRTTLSVEGILHYADNIDLEIIEKIFKSQIEYNLNIVKEGFNYDYGLNVGRILLKNANGSIKEKMKAYAASGSDARMSGCDLPVMINSGSGNQGLTIASPIYIYAKENNINDERLYRALAVANLIPIHIKTRIGRLSAFCGAITAGIGVGCAVTYLNGGTLKNIEDTIKNGIADLTGVICDGAKPSCAIKIASSIDAAFMAYQLAMEGKVVKSGTGIICECTEDTINNVANIASDAMTETDEMILKIMTAH
ncbi:L-cysteine desulfidase family protein [Clostridium sp. DL1XJH146]